MIRLVLLLVAVAPVAAAQNSLADLLPAVGTRWDDVAPSVPAPDSGAVADGAGTLRWSSPEEEVAVLYAVVAGGALRRVEVTFAAGAEPDRRIADMLLQLKSVVGPPADPPFFTARQMYDVAGTGWIDLRVDPRRRLMVFRQPADPPPAAAPMEMPPPPPPSRVK